MADIAQDPILGLYTTKVIVEDWRDYDPIRVANPDACFEWARAAVNKLPLTSHLKHLWLAHLHEDNATALAALCLVLLPNLHTLSVLSQDYECLIEVLDGILARPGGDFLSQSNCVIPSGCWSKAPLYFQAL